MVRYYGRARQRTGSVNTNQLGLKMSGCPGKVGLNPVNNRYIQQRVACNRGVCGIPKVHGVDWRYSMSNAHPFCAEPSGKCLAAAGGIRNIRVPYYRTVQPGKQGCTNEGQFGYYPPNLNVDPVGLDARHFPYGHAPIVNPDGSITMFHYAGAFTLPSYDLFVKGTTAGGFGSGKPLTGILFTPLNNQRFLPGYFKFTPKRGMEGRYFVRVPEWYINYHNYKVQIEKYGEGVHFYACLDNLTEMDENDRYEFYTILKDYFFANALLPFGPSIPAGIAQGQTIVNTPACYLCNFPKKKGEKAKCKH